MIKIGDTVQLESYCGPVSGIIESIAGNMVKIKPFNCICTCTEDSYLYKFIHPDYFFRRNYEVKKLNKKIILK